MISKPLYITSFLLLTGIVLFFGPEVSAQEGVVNNGNPFLIALNEPTNVKLIGFGSADWR